MRFTFPIRRPTSWPEVARNFTALETLLNDRMNPVRLVDNGEVCIIKFDHVAHKLVATHGGVTKTIADFST